MAQDCNIFEVWGEYKNSLHGYIRKRIQNEDDAKDILQNVLLKSYQYCSNGKTVIHLKSWLYKITQNTIADYFKTQTNQSVLDFDIKQNEDNFSKVGEASDYIKELLKLLPIEYAEPLYMYDIEGTEQKIIASKLRLTLPNTKSRIQRARIKLKERFLECCEVIFDENGEMNYFDIKPHCKELQAHRKILEKNLI